MLHCLKVGPLCRVLTQRLLHAAARPYFAALERWLCEGRADGTHGEFMIQENEVPRPVLNALCPSCWLTLYRWKLDDQNLQGLPPCLLHLRDESQSL